MNSLAATIASAPRPVMPGLPGVHGDILDLVGNTPVVDVSNLSPNPNVRIIAKLEMQNPFGSVKDRIAKAMIEAAEKDGRLSPGQTIIEPSSGNTGIALAAIARLKGYPIKILMPESVSVERRQMLQIMGAEVILTPGGEGSNGAVRRATAMAAEEPPQFPGDQRHTNDGDQGLQRHGLLNGTPERFGFDQVGSKEMGHQLAATGRGVGRKFRSLRALLTTDTELKAMAPPAIIGLSSQPVSGKSTPAAIGMPATL